MRVSDEIRTIANQHLQKVRPSGPDNVMALCPFHVKSDGRPEQNPSFAMSLSNGLWFCHACQSKGNLYTFLRDVGIDRGQIDYRYRMILDAANKNMPVEFNPARPQVFSDNPIPDSLLGIFDYCPTDLTNAGFAQPTLQHFEVGFDMTHYRITYPVRDLAGRLVAISGRSVTDSYPKYKIYDTEYVQWDLPARQNWNKREVLWNADKVYPEIYFDTNPALVVVVEGFKAGMWVWQAGIKNVVALLGTYMSHEHKWILERMGAPVYLFLDNNDPGYEGTLKCGEKLRKSQRPFVVEYPERLQDDEKAQPDSLTPEEVCTQVSSARSYFDWLAH